MNLVLYANANEIDLREAGHVSNTDFFCIDGRVHVARKTIWKHGAGISEIIWRDPKPCDASCAVWLKKSLDMPELLQQQVEHLLQK